MHSPSPVQGLGIYALRVALGLEDADSLMPFVAHAFHHVGPSRGLSCFLDVDSLASLRIAVDGNKLHGAGAGTKALFRHAIVGWARVCNAIQNTGNFELCASRIASRTWRYVRMQGGHNWTRDVMTLVAVCRGVEPSRHRVFVYTPFPPFELCSTVQHVLRLVGPCIACDEHTRDLVSCKSGIPERNSVRSLVCAIGSAGTIVPNWNTLRSLRHLSLYGCPALFDFPHLPALVSLSTDCMDLRSLRPDALQHLVIVADAPDILFSGQRFPNLHTLTVTGQGRIITIRDFTLCHTLSSLTLANCAFSPPLSPVVSAKSFCSLRAAMDGLPVVAPAVYLRSLKSPHIDCAVLETAEDLSVFAHWSDRVDCHRLTSLFLRASRVWFDPKVLSRVVSPCVALEKLTAFVRFVDDDRTLDLSCLRKLRSAHLGIVTVPRSTVVLPGSMETLICRLAGASKLVVKEAGTRLRKVSLYCDPKKSNVSACINTLSAMRSPSCCTVNVVRPAWRNVTIASLVPDKPLRCTVSAVDAGADEKEWSCA